MVIMDTLSGAIVSVILGNRSASDSEEEVSRICRQINELTGLGESLTDDEELWKTSDDSGTSSTSLDNDEELWMLSERYENNAFVVRRS